MALRAVFKRRAAGRPGAQRRHPGGPRGRRPRRRHGPPGGGRVPSLPRAGAAARTLAARGVPMSGGRLDTLAHGLWHLHRTPDLVALRAARSPDELARLALIPAARNLGIAIGFLPADLRAEATAALLACRVLDAYEDLGHRPLASGAVLAAVDYLNGATDTPPPALSALSVRD